MEPKFRQQVFVERQARVSRESLPGRLKEFQAREAPG